MWTNCFSRFVLSLSASPPTQISPSPFTSPPSSPLAIQDLEKKYSNLQPLTPSQAFLITPGQYKYPTFVATSRAQQRVCNTIYLPIHGRPPEINWMIILS